MAKSKNLYLLGFLDRPVLALKEYRAIRDFYCCSDSTRRIVLDFTDAVEELFSKHDPWNRHANFLLWAQSGVGKTFLVKQVHGEILSRIKSKVKFHCLPLHELTDRDLAIELGRVDRWLVKGVKVLAFVDELDAWENSYKTLHAAADWNKKGGKPIVWIFAGSHGNSINQMISLVRRRHKGKDLVTRIPRNFMVSIPSLEARDKIIIAAAIARAKGIKRIDKAALMAIALDEEAATSAAIEETIDGACSRLKHLKVITYWSIFPGDGYAYTFARKNRIVALTLEKKETINIE